MLDPNKQYQRVVMRPGNLKFQNKPIYDSLMQLFDYDAKEGKLNLGDWQKNNLAGFIRKNDGDFLKLDLTDKDLNFLKIDKDPDFVRIETQTALPGQFGEAEKSERGYMRFKVNVPDNVLEDMNLATDYFVGEDILDEAQTNIEQLSGDRYSFDIYMPIPDQDVLRTKFAQSYKPADFSNPAYMQMQMQQMALTNPYIAAYGSGFLDNFPNLDQSDNNIFYQSNIANP